MFLVHSCIEITVRTSTSVQSEVSGQDEGPTESHNTDSVYLSAQDKNTVQLIIRKSAMVNGKLRINLKTYMKI